MFGKFAGDRTNSGFTLYEIILVLFILGLLAFVVLPGFASTTDQVRVQVHQANLEKLESAVKLYYLDMGKYPEDLLSLLERPAGEEKWRGPYLEAVPEYPYDSGRHYQTAPGGKIIVK